MKRCKGSFSSSPPSGVPPARASYRWKQDLPDAQKWFFSDRFSGEDARATGNGPESQPCDPLSIEPADPNLGESFGRSRLLLRHYETSQAMQKTSSLCGQRRTLLSGLLSTETGIDNL